MFLENAGFVGEDIAGMTLAVGLNMFKDLTHCILWEKGCVHVCVDMIDLCPWCINALILSEDRG